MKKLAPKSQSRYGKLSNGIVPVDIFIGPLGEKNEVTYSDGSTSEAACLNCVDPPCMHYSNEEILVDLLPGMPQLMSTTVCPTDAIKLGTDGFPVITGDCIGCGICLSRCPYAAIQITNDHVAVINRADPPAIEWVEHFDLKSQAERDRLFLNAESELVIEKIPQAYFDNLYNGLTRASRAKNGLENTFVRNLLLNLGIKNKSRVVGNNEIRFDLIGEWGEDIFIGEVGLNGTDILEEPRAILDDIAVLNARYGIKPDTIVPVIVTLEFPNRRSEVYEVFSDIKNILDIRILSISIHVLIILHLLRRKADPALLQHLFVDKSKTTTLQAALVLIPELKEVDPYWDQAYYQAVK